VKIVGLEEHYVTADVIDAWRKLEPRWQDPSVSTSAESDIERRLLSLDEERLSVMDDAGVDTQVLSLTTPGLWNLDVSEAVALQTACNGRLADAVRAHPERLHGFATVAAQSPDAAAEELDRAVRTLGFHGALIFSRVRDRSIDHGDFWPLFEPPRHWALRSICILKRLRRRCGMPTTTGLERSSMRHWERTESAGITTRECNCSG
jgi:uncharacterized protein